MKAAKNGNTVPTKSVSKLTDLEIIRMADKLDKRAREITDEAYQLRRVVIHLGDV